MAVRPVADVRPWRGLVSPNMGRAFGYLRGHYGLLAMTALFVLLYLPLAFIEPFLLKFFIDRILVFHDTQLMVRLMVIMVVFFAVCGLVEFGSNYFVARLALRLQALIKSAQLRNMLAKSLNFFKGTATGRVIFCFFNDASQIGMLLSAGLMETILNVLLILMRGGLMLYIAAPLVPIYLAMLPVQGWIMYRLARRVMAYQIEMRGMDEELTARIESMLSGSLAVKALGLGGALQDTWKRVFDQRLGLDFRNTLWQRGGLLAIGQVQIVGSFLALFYGVYLMDSATLTLGDLLAFLAVSGRITPSFGAIITFLVGMQAALVGVERYYKVHDLPDEDAEFARARRGGGGGAVRDLTLPELGTIVVANPRVDHGTAVVSIPCAFEMERSKHYLWHGPNGAGKTSLALALAGLLPHSRGAIRVRDVPLSDFSLASIRRHVLYVGGEPFWPERPLSENFTDNGHGGHLDEPRLEEVLQITEAQEVLDSLPLGLGTVFDNNGRSLSRGESQRLFLAVALYQRPEVVILDEVLSSVPLPMRRRILRRLRTFSPGTLLVYITPTAEEIADFDGEVRFTRRAWSTR